MLKNFRDFAFKGNRIDFLGSVNFTELYISLNGKDYGSLEEALI
jgi:large-conductance mechanosensitive channel